MILFEIIIQKSNVRDDALPIGDKGKLMGITEVTIDVHLFGSKRSFGSRRHQMISHFIGINIRFVFICRFQSFDQSVERFGIVFSHINLNVGGTDNKKETSKIESV